MPLNQGRASRVTDLGDGTVLRVGGVPEREAQIMDLYPDNVLISTEGRRTLARLVRY